jgi:mannitol-specific phosphotransferase system IIBC component
MVYMLIAAVRACLHAVVQCALTMLMIPVMQIMVLPAGIVFEPGCCCINVYCCAAAVAAAVHDCLTAQLCSHSLLEHCLLEPARAAAA